MALGPPLRAWPALLLPLSLAIGAGAGACSPGAASTGAASTTAGGQDVPQAKAKVRLYLLSTIAGALEPCGCSKDQLGGLDHLAAFMASHADKAEHRALIAAGPVFFMDPQLSAKKETQDKWKAEALAKGLARLSPKGWAPGANDWAGGGDMLRQLATTAGLQKLGSNVAEDALDAAGFVKTGEIDLKGLKIGIVGLVDPSVVGAGPAKVGARAPLDALKEHAARLRAGGANMLVVSAALQRGEALRLVDEVPDIDLLLVGRAMEKGDLNDKPKPAQLLGKTLVVETSNHLQTVAYVDVFVREDLAPGAPVALADAGGVAREEEIVSVAEQIRELEHRINGWERDKGVNAADVAARKKDLSVLQEKRRELERAPAPPTSGSYFRYQLVEVRDTLGVDKGVADEILAYYKRVNAHNKDAFAGRKPDAPAEGQASYIGLEACTSCHEEERAVWDKTPHARAYATLEKQFVEYNLDCVGCHVTGYEKPGGSTVTHVDKLKDVQCEVCHGPGSLHANAPQKKELIVTRPDPKTCVSECHHPPHVEGFDAVAKMRQVLGPGHGL